MPKNKKHYYYKNQSQQKVENALKNTGIVTSDAFQNSVARMGFNMPNLLEGTKYPITRITKDYNLMNSLYRSHWIVRRIVDTIPEDMCKNWYSFSTELPPEKLDLFRQAEKKTQVKSKLEKGIKWGRLYGGAGALMMIEGQEDQLSEPLDIDTIMPGSFKGLMILDRWAGISSVTELVSDISSSEFGLPKYYHITSDASKDTVKIHHSRVLRFTGDELPYWEQQAEMYWGASVIESVFEELKKRDNTSFNIASLIFLANLRVLKMDQLGQELAVGDQQTQQRLYNTLSAQNWLQSNLGMYVMDAKDDFQTHQYTFAGINEIYESFMCDISGASQIPMTKLFGRSPGGLNATGEGDLTNYYNLIEQKQESQMRPALEKLHPVMAMSTWGEVPDDLEAVFNPVKTLDDKEIAEVVDKKTTAILNVYNALGNEKLALKELKQMSDSTGMFSNITDDDIEKADDTFGGQGEFDLGDGNEGQLEAEESKRTKV